MDDKLLYCGDENQTNCSFLSFICPFFFLLLFHTLNSISQFLITRMLKICITVFSTPIQAMLFKLGRHMNIDLLLCVIENQDPGSYFSLLIKSSTISWLPSFDIYYSFYIYCIARASQRDYSQIF